MIAEDSAYRAARERMIAEDSAYEAARERMIRSQIVARGITDERLLQALARVERHRFIGPEYRADAYEDYPLPIEAGQTISQPYIVALMTQLLDLDGDEKILEVGTGSGYQAAILAELADSVFTIEIVDALAQSARTLLAELGYTNIMVRSGDGYQGWPEEAPFDGIMVTCAPPEIPRSLLDQLAEGGRLVIPVGTYAQQLLLVEKRGGRLFEETVLPVRFVPMTGDGVEKK
ncbi:MAG: protein-L-isoaspartate(D-aspartate) O-methyltransferase [Candidatus Eisenbacteria sp.]|nr:protein-L-isoaspartate(D-aspartate) O-methyltransferase [Candidatus Eisenbacteria bacterium]